MATALALAALADAAPPLVAPLVTPVLWSQPPDLYLSRGILLCQEGRWQLWGEALDPQNHILPVEDWQRSSITWALNKEFQAAQFPYRLGDPCHHGQIPAVHCQADSITSVAGQIRDGQLLLRLMENLYLESPRFWTLRGINLGAGIDVCGANCSRDDPLQLWQAAEAAQMVLIDADADRLREAMRKARDERSNQEPLEIVTMHRTLTPVDVEAGALDEILSSLNHEVDILKIDVDSYDCDLLQALLVKVKAYVVIMESQPLIPPPFKFARAFQRDDPVKHGLIGCSLSYQLQLAKPQHELLVFTEQDTIFVHRDLLKDLEMVPPGRLFPWTSYPLRFPVDPVDCFRRSRFLHDTDAAERSVDSGSPKKGRSTPAVVPLDFAREWLEMGWLRPMTTLDLMWRNITALNSSYPLDGMSPLQDVRYILDV